MNTSPLNQVKNPKVVLGLNNSAFSKYKPASQAKPNIAESKLARVADPVAEEDDGDESVFSISENIKMMLMDTEEKA